MATGIYNRLFGSHLAPSEGEETLRRGMRWTLSQPYTDEDCKKHLTVRSAVLNDLKEQGRLFEEQLTEVKDFRLDYDSGLIKLTIAQTGDTVAVGFEEVVDADAKVALKGLIDRVNTEKFFGEHWSAAGIEEVRYRGNPHGAAPLQRESNAAKNLVKSSNDARDCLLPKYVASAPEGSQRQAIVKRLAYATFCARKMSLQLEVAIREKEGVLKNLEKAESAPQGAGGRIIGLSQEIKQLKALRKEFNHLDFYALTTALAKLPHGGFSYDALKEATAQVQGQVTGDLGGKSKDDMYIKSVAGLLHRSRGEYALYCKDQGIPQQKESLENLILHEAVRVADGAAFDKGVVEKSSLFCRMTPALRSEIAQLFGKTDSLGQVALPDVEVTFAGSDQGVIKAQLSGYFDAVKWDQTELPISRSGRLGAAFGALVAGPVVDHLTSGAVRSHGHYAMAHPIEAMQSALTVFNGLNYSRHLWSNMGQLPYAAATSLALGASAVYVMGSAPTELVAAIQQAPQYAIGAFGSAQTACQLGYRFLRPEVGSRTGLDRRIKRSWKGERIALVSVASLAALYTLKQGMFPEQMTGATKEVMAYAVDTLWNNLALATIAAGVRQSMLGQTTHLTAGVAKTAFKVIEHTGQVASFYRFSEGVHDCALSLWTADLEGLQVKLAQAIAGAYLVAAVVAASHIGSMLSAMYSWSNRKTA